MTGTFELSTLRWITPEILLALLAGVLLALDLVWKTQKQRLAWVTAAGLLVIAGVSLVIARPEGSASLLFGGMLRADGATFLFRLVFLTGAALTALFSLDQPGSGSQGEYYALLVVATLGMDLMASSADLVMLYLAIETTSIPLYVLAGSLVRDPKSVEAGIKYFLFGALTSTVMLYGFSLLYGFTGTTHLYQLAELLKASQVPLPLVLLALMLVLVGFGFKISGVPFHFWAPDVYEGAPAPVAGFLSTASKAAGFAVLIRVLLAVFPGVTPAWTLLVAILSAASMLFGNLLALTQKNIKRLLAYSSIAQAGYILVGVAADSQLGMSGAMFYLVSYLVTNLAAFGIVALVGRTLGSDEIDAYAGLSRRSPGLALALLVSLLSLGGIPPLGGFVGKLLVFAAAVQANQAWLAFVGVLTSVIGLTYYLTVLKVVYLYPAAKEAKPLVLSPAWRLALVICVAGILLLGSFFGPWYSWSAGAAAGLFS